MKYFPLIKKIAIILLISLSLLVGSAIFFFWKYKDKIIALVVKELSEELNSEVKVGKVDISLKKFPDLSIHFHQVMMKGSLPREDTLLFSNNIYCTFRFWDVFNQNYRIRQVFLEDGKLNIVRINRDNNYQVLKKSKSSSGNSVRLDVEKLVLKNFIIDYNDFDHDQYYSYTTDNTEADLSLKDDYLNVGVEGKFISKIMLINERIFARDLPFEVTVDLIYTLSSHHVQFLPSTLSSLGSAFDITGHVSVEDYQFSINGNETEIQSLLALLPEGFDDEIKTYKSKGDIFFSANIEGLIQEDIPLVEVQFGCDNAQFYHPKYNESVKNVSLVGTFTNGIEHNYKTSSLKLTNIIGTLKGRQFKGNLDLANFDHPYLAFDLLADIDANSLLKFFPIPQIAKANGDLYVDVQFKGQIDDMRNINRLNRVKSTGEINFKQLDFMLKDVSLAFNGFTGNLLFQDDAVAISDFSGKISNSDFLINGFIKNGLAYLLFNNVPLMVEADLVSEKIMLNELLSGTSVDDDNGPSSYNFRISPRLDIDFNCKVGYLEFRRFQAKDIKGQLLVRNKMANSKEISFSAMGGRMVLNGSVNARKENNIEVFTNTKLDRIDIDQLFYVFEDFNQDFITNKHLRGQIFADLNTYMIFDDHLRLNDEKLISDIVVSIKNGELNHFEPMKKLSKYVDEKSLEKLRFSELKNQILVQNRNIYLPQMEVVSNVTKLKVNGTHTFDQHIDYHVVTPIKRLNKTDRDERFGHVRDDGKGNLNLFLKIHGTTSDYKISYDGEAWKENFKQNAKNEVQELKDVFRTKGKVAEQQQESTEINEDEFFDF